MPNIRIYGDYTPNTIPQAYEPPPEIKAKQKRFEILTITALVLLFVLLSHGLILVTARIVYTALPIKEVDIFLPESLYWLWELGYGVATTISGIHCHIQI